MVLIGRSGLPRMNLCDPYLEMIMEEQALRILLVEDDEAHAEMIRRAFAEYAGPVHVMVVNSLAAARVYQVDHRPDLVITDLLLPDGRGTELLPAGDQDPLLPIVIMTGYGDERVAVEAVKAGALDYVVKSPETLIDLPRIAERALREWGHLIERRRAEEALRQSERRFRALTEHSSDVVVVLDSTGLILYASPSTTRIMGYPLVEHIGQNALDLIYPEDLHLITALFSRLLDHPESNITVEVRMCHYDGSWRWIEVTGTNLLADPAVQGIVVNYRDVTERKQVEIQLQHDALYDGLTGLPNRLLLADRLEQVIKRTQRHPNYRFAVLFLDLDHFKVVNDSLGHTLGDQLLVAIAPRLSHCLRASDTCARLGGDEFVILLEDIQDISDATHIAERIQMHLSQPFDLNDLKVVTSASIGIVVSTIGYDRSEDVLRDADIAMYRAKAQGKAQYTVFDIEMRNRALARLALEADIRRAIEHQEFCVYYQPVIELSTGRIVGFEALVRWQHPQRGLIAPAEFIAVAEETGLIVLIDWLVLREASRQMRQWQDQVPLTSSLVISVNLSGKQFTRPDLITQIEHVLAETGLDPRNLRIEITESTLMENMETAAMILRQLHTLGVKVAIDDFGTGYSSLGYLVRLPVNILKIDRRFISELETDDNQAEIVNTIVTMAHNLGMQVIAEGVETTTQHVRLNALGCEYGQGYLISRPIDSAMAEELTLRQLSYLPHKREEVNLLEEPGRRQPTATPAIDPQIML